jgi:hypothetical protein
MAGNSQNVINFGNGDGKAGPQGALVIPPFLMGLSGRIYAASFSFWAGVIPPMPMFGRSLL